MKKLNKKQISLLIIILTVITLIVVQINKTEINKQENINDDNSVSTWDPETASFVKYNSEEYENIRKRKIEEYANAIKGTIVEQVQNIAIPQYIEGEHKNLQNGEIVVRSEKSSDFPDGVFQWGAYLTKDINSFTVGDFNNDGEEDVAHIIGYTGGGSGYFYNLTVFVNDKGKLKYLTQEELGDRIVIKSLRYNSGEFIVDVITQGEGDDFRGYCCPNVPATIRLKITDNRLVEI